MEAPLPVLGPACAQAQQGEQVGCRWASDGARCAKDSRCAPGDAVCRDCLSHPNSRPAPRAGWIRMRLGLFWRCCSEGVGLLGLFQTRANAPQPGQAVCKSTLTTAWSQTKLAHELELHSAVGVHPRVVRLHGFSSDASFCYLLLDAVGSGTTLSDAVRHRGAIPEWEVASHMRAMLSGLAYLHSIGIAHRDVKPANCLLRGTEARFPLGSGQDSSLVLCDLGLAARCPPKRTGLCGTPNFVAPEVLARTGHDTQVDVWSAGAVAFTLLAGVPPFKAPSVDATYVRVRSGIYTPLSHVSGDACDFLARSLCMCPDARATAAELLQHPFTAPAGEGYGEAVDALCGRLAALRTRTSAANGADSPGGSMRSGGTPDDEEEPRLRRISSVTPPSGSDLDRSF